MTAYVDVFRVMAVTMVARPPVLLLKTQAKKPALATAATEAHA